MGIPETVRRIEDHSYDPFSQQEFYRELNMKLLKSAPKVHTMVDFATGTGAIIEHMIELDRLLTPFAIVGIDIDESALEIARSKFTDYNLDQGDDIIDFIHSSVLDTDLPENTQELVTFFNSAHLLDEPEKAIAEAGRILVPNGTILINTGYEKDYGYPNKEAQNQWATLAAMARRILRKKYNEFDEPVNYFRNTANDYLKWLKNAGFKYSVLKREIVRMDKKAMRAICSYKDFARGSFPNIPVEDSIQAFNEALDSAFERMKTDYFQRGWYSFRARKNTA